MPFFGGVGFLPLGGRLPLLLGEGRGALGLGEGGLLVGGVGCGFGGGGGVVLGFGTGGGGGVGLLFSGGGDEGGGGSLSATDTDFRRGPVPLKKSGVRLVGSCWIFKQRLGLDGGYRVSSTQTHKFDEKQRPQHAGTGGLA